MIKNRQQAEESGAENGATQGLLSDYNVRPGSSVLRTIRTPSTSDNLMQVSAGFLLRKAFNSTFLLEPQKRPR